MSVMVCLFFSWPRWRLNTSALLNNRARNALLSAPVEERTIFFFLGGSLWLGRWILLLLLLIECRLWYFAITFWRLLSAISPSLIYRRFSPLWPLPMTKQSNRCYSWFEMKWSSKCNRRSSSAFSGKELQDYGIEFLSFRGHSVAFGVIFNFWSF